jgi:hypothetical protein
MEGVLATQLYKCTQSPKMFLDDATLYDSFTPLLEVC